MVLRQSRNGRRSACTFGFHHGDALLSVTLIASFLHRGRQLEAGYFGDFRLVAPPRKKLRMFKARSGAVLYDAGKTVTRKSYGKGHRLLSPQGQRSRRRRQALRRSDGAELSSRQG